MKIIISPAKIMKEDVINHYEGTKLIFPKQSEEILAKLQSLSKTELNQVLKVNDKLLETNYERLKNLDLKKLTNNALFSYNGIQYNALSANTLTAEALDYLEENLLIVSALFGFLKPSTLIKPYRIEMQANLKVGTSNNLYDYYQDLFFDYLKDEVIINLASKEYSKGITSKLKKDQVYNIYFKERKGDKLVEKSTEIKKTRGHYLRYLALENITEVEDLKKFNQNYTYSIENSSEYDLVFIKND